MNPLDEFLTRANLVPPQAKREWVALTGGVSSDIWRVDIEGRPSVCVKRALPTLKVAAHWEVPTARNAYEWAWIEFVAESQPLAVPRLLGHDPSAGLFAMEYLPPERYPVWKQQLMAGQVDPETAAAVGQSLGRIHHVSAHRADLRAAFDTTTGFRSIRLEPYLETTARRHPRLADTLHALVRRTADTRIALVHGDVSPKNILVGPQGPVFLDAECAWYGDPSFDVAFCLNHLMLKLTVRPGRCSELHRSFDEFVHAYFDAARFEERASLEARAADLLPALLLSRVDGKSPVEYLENDAMREAVRREAVAMLDAPTASLIELGHRWFTPRRADEFSLMAPTR